MSMLSQDTARRIADRLAEPETDTWGPAGTYGCACVSRDARNCALIRYGYSAAVTDDGYRCPCMCHQWDDDDDEAQGSPRQ